MDQNKANSEPRTLGITGGIGTGKSSLCEILVETYQAPAIDADQLGHEALLPGSSVYESVIARFGEGVVRPGGAIDRSALARIVFRDAAELAALNGIVHPWILERIEARRAALMASGYAGIVLLDAALLLDWLHRFRPDGIVVVTAPFDVRLRRLEARGLPEAEARRRIEHQRAEDEWAAPADWVVDNGGDLDDLEEAAKSLWTEVCARLNC